MLAFENRFHGHNTVNRVRGKKLQTEFFTINYSNNYRERPFRVAVVISKKISKLAVDRNKVRRRIYEIIRKSKLLDNTNLNVVIYVKNSSILKSSSSKMEPQIINSLKKITLHQ